jgi:hypothetical protein
MVSPAPNVIHDQLSAARLHLKKWEAEPWPPLEYAFDRKPTTPSEWFSKMFPEQAKTHGCPFIELVEDRADGLRRINPLAQNLDFLAAILGGDSKLEHKVIYLEGEMQWYYLDPRDTLFKPTTDEKLANLLRAYLIRCAEELPDSVHKLNLFLEFRSDKTIRAIIHRAKSILAADHTFFSVESRHQRQKGPEIHERLARVFVEQVLERQPGEFLTLSNAYLIFCEYLRGKGMVPVKRTIFKRMFCPLVRDAFNVGLRHDIINPETQKQGDGWKGIGALDLEAGVLGQENVGIA